MPNPTPLIIVLNWPNTEAEQLTASRKIIDCVSADARCAGFTPSAATVLTVWTTAQSHHNDAVKRVPDAAASFHTTIGSIHESLKEWIPQVKQVALRDPANAVAIVHSLGYGTKKSGTRAAKQFEAEDTTNAGEVHLSWPAVPKAGSYRVEISTDNVSWTYKDTSMKARITLTGLTSGQKYWFRYVTTTRTGTLAPSAAIWHVIK